MATFGIAPVAANSAAYIAWIGNKRVHPDWGASANDTADPTATYGMPYVSVPGTQPLVPVTRVAYGDESDDGAPGRPPGSPIPPEAKTTPGYVEGGQPGSVRPSAAPRRCYRRDPDQCGQRGAGTHPRGLVARLLAEGLRRGAFTTRIALANPSPTGQAFTQLRFERDDGVVVRVARQVPPLQRVTVETGAIADLQGHAFATVVESDRFVAVDRLVQWDQGRGSHAEHGLSGPSTTWHFAEGATYPGFSLFYLRRTRAMRWRRSA